MRLAFGEAPEQVGVDGPESELSPLGPFARAFYVVEDPGDFGAREIGVEHEAGLLLDPRFVGLVFELANHACGAAVLPDDGIVDGFAGLAVPDHGGFALVGNANCGDVRVAGLFTCGLDG